MRSRCCGFSCVQAAAAAVKDTMRLIRSIAILSFLAACSSDPSKQAKVVQVVDAACVIDHVFQPVVVALAPAAAAAVPGGEAVAAGAVAVDQTLVHPAVEAACAALGGHAAP